jgi:hypothetical protein
MDLVMTLRLAHTADDGARTYHDRVHRIAAVVGSAAAILARYRRGYRDFDIYGAPAQADGPFMLARPDIDRGAIGREPGVALLPAGARWLRLTEAELAAFADEPSGPGSAG